MASSGKSTEYIDKVVKISDKKAIKALDDLCLKIVGVDAINWWKVSTNRIDKMINLYNQDANDLLLNKNHCLIIFSL
jgi:kynurenine formamidase